MCWSAEVSLASFAFATIGLLVGLYTNFNRRLLLIGYVFSFMQFVEYNLWNNLKNPAGNRFWSMMGDATIWGEILASINLLTNPLQRSTMFGLAGLHFVLSELLFPGNREFKTTVGPSGHLSHDWYPNTPLARLNAAFIILPFWLQGYTSFAWFVTLTFLYSAYMYHKTNEFSSMWCFFALGFWFLVMYQGIRKL